MHSLPMSSTSLTVPNVLDQISSRNTHTQCRFFHSPENSVQIGTRAHYQRNSSICKINTKKQMAYARMHVFICCKALQDSPSPMLGQTAHFGDISETSSKTPKDCPPLLLDRSFVGFGLAFLYGSTVHSIAEGASLY